MARPPTSTTPIGRFSAVLVLVVPFNASRLGSSFPPARSQRLETCASKARPPKAHAGSPTKWAPKAQPHRAKVGEVRLALGRFLPTRSRTWKLSSPP